MSVLSNRDDIPIDLYNLIRWILVGSEGNLESEIKDRTIDRSTLTIGQNIMFAIKTERQVKNVPKNTSESFRIQTARENPQALGLALAIHHDTRNEKLIDLLHAHNYCASYNRTMLFQTAVANAIVENTKQFGGLYVPPFLKKGTFVFFAIDNTDFAEDTVDGKGTTHGTVTAVYQKANAPGEVIAPSLEIQEVKTQSVQPYHVPMKHCNKPKPGPYKSEQEFRVCDIGTFEAGKQATLGWMIAYALSSANSNSQEKIPGWSGYKSLVSYSRPLTRVCAFPLLPEVAHEWSTLLTVIMQANQLKNLVIGENHPTLITFDMALYEKVVQMIDSCSELKKKIIPRLGELHTVMAALRALGTSIENSGIDDAWIEGDIYGPATTRQILKCSHYKRSLCAHIHTYMALYELALEQFFTEMPHLKEVCIEPTKKLQDAITKTAGISNRSEGVKLANTSLLHVLENEKVFQMLKEWENQKSSNAMFKSLMNYLHRVEAILFFIEASRNADLTKHLEAGDGLGRLFFAFNRWKYKRLWPRYLADMYEIKTKYPATWQNLNDGNISVTKSEIPFVSIGADHACEHLNRMMKVHSGLVGISKNANARQRFFLDSPVIADITTKFKEQFRQKVNEPERHHDMRPHVIRREHEAVNKIKTAILSHGNPFAAEGDQLYNFITQAYVPQEYVSQILNADDIGQKLYEEYVAQRINGDDSLWLKVKKLNNNMYMSGNKKQTVKIRDQTVDLRETKNLTGRLMILSRSNRDIDQKHAISNHEFTLTPRALFAPDGSMLPCTDKAKIIHSLQKLASSNENIEQIETQATIEQDPFSPSETSSINQKIAIVDGMVLVQKMAVKKGTLNTVKDLAESFNNKLTSLTEKFSEIILVFDTYRPNSLKEKTRERRRQGKAPIQYKIADDTIIKHIPFTRFLSHEKTKADLTDYLAKAVLNYKSKSPQLVITSASGHTRSNRNLHFEDNNHEEADTLMICLAAKASQRCPNAHLVFFTPDTDVLILAVANYDQLCKRTSISMVSGIVDIEPIWRVMGKEKAKALHVFHAFTGADNIGKFSGIGKAKWFQQYIRANVDLPRALMKLPLECDLAQDVRDTLIKFVCSVYCPKGVVITSIPELRWHLFCKQLAESNRLPPTLGALDEHIKRVRLQSRIWNQATAMLQQPFDPLEYGYYKDTYGNILPVTTHALPAPMAIIELVRCQCKKDCSTQSCTCRKYKLPCTELCLCSAECTNDEDCVNEIVIDHDDNDDNL